MIRLRNPDLQRIEHELRRLNKILGWTEPLPMYRPGFGARHFAYEDFINSMLVILGGTVPLERVNPVQQLPSSGAETVCDSKQSADSRPDSPSLNLTESITC